MWHEDYLESLSPLPGALDEVGLSTQVLGVSLAPSNTKQWDHSFSATMMGSVSTMLEILKDTGFLFLLGQFSTLLSGLETISLLLPDEWKKPFSEGGILNTPAPSLRILVQFAPWKIYRSFQSLRVYLEQVEEDWDGQNCLTYLSVVQEELETLQPLKTLNVFKALYSFLNFHYPFLTWLASYPEGHVKPTYLNFWPMCRVAKKVMDSKMEYYNDCLTDLQEVLQDLNQVEAVVPSAEDLDLY